MENLRTALDTLISNLGFIDQRDNFILLKRGMKKIIIQVTGSTLDPRIKVDQEEEADAYFTTVEETLNFLQSLNVRLEE